MSEGKLMRTSLGQSKDLSFLARFDMAFPARGAVI
jgi:hypothetical protein